MQIASYLTSWIRVSSIVLLVILFVAAGVNHFVSPEVYLKIMPDYLHWQRSLVYVSGFFEIVGGLGMAIPRLRRAAGCGVIALLIAVFPANVDMVVNSDQFRSIPYWALVARLPLQGLLIAWVWWATVRHPDTANSARDAL
ncbi:DoxX family protein [Allorhodopirellula heiligendammensis]|uniref:DoxX n=1 Tax=Allorhodopirellula heiligendammensis TaxID=2714739 RepID=A0A5C6B630_9BACT|nr:DoxX family protein [Allorhodopirellula heiligendammensis]TWU07410.1 hypothetical protein Poly21_55880 [Allorhodopirellula heiligendammensis]